MLGLTRPLQYIDNARMDNLYLILVFATLFNYSSQAPTMQICPPCFILCTDSFIHNRLPQCRPCQCEPIRHAQELVPVVICSLKVCTNSCGFMGYKLDNTGCKSCECQEI